MKKSIVDISVLLVFFTRHEQFKQVFEQVKKARPSELFLYQDGPREGRQDDIENIEKCREIAEDIDWECEVHKCYQGKNVGCDPSGYIAQTWAFSNTDKCIVLEDDVVPSVSFFLFCKEMLDKYENDERIMLITGLNVDGITNYCENSYFFSSTTFTVGCWASWKRVVSQWEKNYEYLSNSYYKKLVQQTIKLKQLSGGFISSCVEHKKSGKEHFETIMISNQYLNSGLTIIPQKNMVQNIGFGGEATHTTSSLSTLPKGYRKPFELEKYEIDTGLVHPLYILEDYSYKKRAYKIYGWGHPLIKVYRFIESSFYKIRNGDICGICIDISDKIKKVFLGTIS